MATFDTNNISAREGEFVSDHLTPDALAEELKEIAEDAWLGKIDHYVPSAWLGHGPFLRFLIREFKPKVMVELGVHNGFSYFVGCQTIQELNLETLAFAVDHWEGDSHAGKLDQKVFESVQDINLEYAHFSTLMRMSFETALLHFEDDSIELLHIDGFHTYESVKNDFDSWLPKMQKNGVILLHDIHVRRQDFGVFKLWNELKSKYQTLEFVGSHGLGVIFLGEIRSSGISRLLEYAKEGHISLLQGVFCSLGDEVVQNFGTAYQNSPQAEILRQQAKIESMEAALEAMINSKTWRFTSPVRWIIKTVKGRIK
jgi:hypothetical protein